MEDGRAKLLLTWKTLQLRRTHPQLFRDGDYRRLRVRGSQAQHLCAFARRLRQQSLVVIAPRLYRRLLGDEGGLPLGEAVWSDTLIELPREERSRVRCAMSSTARSCCRSARARAWACWPRTPWPSSRWHCSPAAAMSRALTQAGNAARRRRLTLGNTKSNSELRAGARSKQAQDETNSSPSGAQHAAPILGTCGSSVGACPVGRVCGQHPHAREPAGRARSLRAYSGEPIDHFTWLGRYDGWQPIGRYELIVFTGVSDAYLIKVGRRRARICSSPPASD